MYASLDSPLLSAARGGRDARSPGLASLKEAFDITYAVHRMEEEGARRRAQKGGANRGFLSGLNEEDEEEDEQKIEDVLRRERTQGIGAKVAAKRAVADGLGPRYDGRAGQRDQGKKLGGSKPFELDMDAATLLGRRHKRGGANAFGSSPLSRSAVAQNERLEESMTASMNLLPVA